MSLDCDVLVVGAGPAGAAVAQRLAREGADVLVVEKKRFPREKTCGDGLTPRSVKALADLGMVNELDSWHRVRGLRAYGGGHVLELDWPEHPVFPSFGCVVTRAELDAAIADRARKEGARILEETEATEPVVVAGHLEAVRVRPKGDAVFEVRPRFVVVADGSLSRFGRTLGTTRDRKYPLGMAIRGYFDSPRSDDDYIESHLDIHDRDGRALPGYGWIFPEGDGSVNLGIGLLSTFREWKGVNTSHLMEAFCHMAPDYWAIDPEAGRSVRGGKLQMGLSVRPRAGPNWVVVGDAAGAINPFNGEGIAYALETAEVAARVLGDALRFNDGSVLHRYPEMLDARYGAYYRAARAFVRLIGEPKAMRLLTGVGMRSRPVMQFALRVMANLLAPELKRPEEILYRVAEKLVLLGPEP
ncbi:MAG: geranylgeranyl reductase family protein [Acidimicrobiia bacterium]|nr:geranylgeranyl reductase family protein [Acidimicrobiia bacterium]